jgi:pyruvate kinase
VRAGQRLLIDDGEIEVRVESRNSTDLICEVIVGGDLKSRKGVNAPETRLSLSSLTDKDRSDVVFALKQQVDYIAMSFVRSADDMRELRWMVRHLGGDVGLIAKIEKSEAIEVFEEILEHADGIMVARGDLGLEIPASEVPIQQKRIIRLCNQMGKPVITATQMLNSMIYNPRPTRAEASDVANAIFDGTDAIMLSGETASGKYPLESVQTMVQIACAAEAHLSESREAENWQRMGEKGSESISDAISHATSAMARILNAKLIVTSTWTGYTALRVARERPSTPILCVTPNEQVYHRMALVWGVIPRIVQEFHTIDDMIEVVTQAAYNEEHLVQTGDVIIIIGGFPFGQGGQTNLVKIHQVGEKDGQPRSS